MEVSPYRSSYELSELLSLGCQAYESSVDSVF